MPEIVQTLVAPLVHHSSNGRVCYKLLDDFGHLEGRNRSRILFTDRLPHLLALCIFLDFPERDPWAMCTGLGRSPPGVMVSHEPASYPDRGDFVLVCTMSYRY